MGNETKNAHKLAFKITHLHVKMHLWRRHFVFVAVAERLTGCGGSSLTGLARFFFSVPLSLPTEMPSADGDTHYHL